MPTLNSIVLVLALAGGTVFAQTASDQTPTGRAAAEQSNRPPKRVDPERARPGGVAMSGAPSLNGVQSRIYPLVNVDLTDKRGVSSRIVAFHRISGENRFVGFLGAAEIEVPYEKIKEANIATADEPGGRMRAHFRLSSGKIVKATFDEREGEQLFAGYAEFGRVTIYWRDIRRLSITARTKTTDLPKFGPATSGVDVLLKDRGGIETELIAFRRATGDNFISGLLGAARVEVPLRIMRKATFHRPDDSPLLRCVIELRDRKPVHLRLKSYEEEKLYRGRAEFGDLRIRLSQVKELTVHRSTPKLRDLDPVAAAEGREVEIDKKPRR
jgi:hypothetical protein